MSQLATLAEHRLSGTGTDSLHDLRIKSRSVLNASTTGMAEDPTYSVHVRPGVGFIPPTMVAHSAQVGFESDPLAGAMGATVLVSSAWEDGSVVAEGATTQIVASGTNYILASAKPSAFSWLDYLGNHPVVELHVSAHGLLVDTPSMRLDSSADLLLTGNLSLGFQETAEASTESISPATNVDEEAANFEALLSQIRSEYEELPEAEWFKKVYVGKSLGDVIHEL